VKYRTVFKKINMAYMTKITKRDKTEKSAASVGRDATVRRDRVGGVRRRLATGQILPVAVAEKVC